MWQVPLQPDKENLRKIVKAYLISEKQRSSSSSMESRIAALESANLMELSQAQDEEERGDKLTPCIVYNFDDILRACGKSHQSEDRTLSLMFETSGHRGVVSALRFNNSGTFLATGCSNGLVNIWSIQVFINCRLNCRVRK